jgi:signal transduction histidine kinase
MESIVETLQARKEDIANQWRTALLPSIPPRLDTQEVKAFLVRWTQQVITILTAEPFRRENARAIGEILAHNISAEAQILSKTQTVLIQQILTDMSAEQAKMVQPRLAELVGEIAIGFIRVKEESIRAMRGQFLSTTSHDMRSPLNAIIGFSRVILKGIDGPLSDLQEQDLNAVYEGGQKMLQFVNDVFNIEKAEVGRIDLDLKDLDMTKVVDAAVAAAQPMIDENDNTLAIHYSDTPGPMYSDGEKIQLVLKNLLAHAAKFTRQGSIMLSISEDAVDGARWVQFEIADTGLGMTPGQVEHFQEAGDPTTLKYGDIGLTISQRYCKLLGGEIALESEVGKGTTFTVKLPARHPAAE